MTILREWRAEVARERKVEYLDYVLKTGIAGYKACAGNLGAAAAVRDIDDERSEIVTLSWWESFDAIRLFAGDDINRAVYFPADDNFLLTRPESVTHYEMGELL